LKLLSEASVPYAIFTFRTLQTSILLHSYFWVLGVMSSFPCPRIPCLMPFFYSWWPLFRWRPTPCTVQNVPGTQFSWRSSFFAMPLLHGGHLLAGSSEHLAGSTIPSGQFLWPLCRFLSALSDSTAVCSFETSQCLAWDSMSTEVVSSHPRRVSIVSWPGQAPTCEQLSVEWERIIAAVRFSQFKLVLGVSCEECFCEEILCVIFGLRNPVRLLYS
jgi:hypothetical protein